MNSTTIKINERVFILSDINPIDRKEAIRLMRTVNDVKQIIVKDISDSSNDIMEYVTVLSDINTDELHFIIAALLRHASITYFMGIPIPVEFLSTLNVLTLELTNRYLLSSI